MLLEKEREKVIAVAKKALSAGLISLTFGNFSLRERKTGYICITPSGMDYHALKPEDIVVIDSESNVIDGKRKFSVETPLHSLTYRKRPDVFGICHTHSIFAASWSSCDCTMPVVLAEMAALVGSSVATAPYRRMGTMELAETVTDILADKYAVLMANHGVLTVGNDLDSAFSYAAVVEENAKAAYLASRIGRMRPLPAEECLYLAEWLKKK